MFKVNIDYPRRNSIELDADYEVISNSKDWFWHADEYCSYWADVVSVMVDGHEEHVATYYCNSWQGVVVIDDGRDESISFADMKQIEAEIESETGKSVEAFL